MMAFDLQHHGGSSRPQGARSHPFAEAALRLKTEAGKKFFSEASKEKSLWLTNASEAELKSEASKYRRRP